MDASLNRLVRRARIHIRAAYGDPAVREVALLQESKKLLPALLTPRLGTPRHDFKTIRVPAVRCWRSLGWYLAEVCEAAQASNTTAVKKWSSRFALSPKDKSYHAFLWQLLRS